LQPLLTKLDGHNKFLSASANSSEALKSISNLDSGIGVTNNAHPLFAAMGQKFYTDSQDSANEAKNDFTFLSFFMVEFLGGFLYALGLIFNPKRTFENMTIAEYQAMVKHLNNFGNALPSPNENPALIGNEVPTAKKPLMGWLK
jgi:hypothetical protein